MAREAAQAIAMTELGSARKMLADSINAEIADVPENARIDSFERWDSLAHMHLLLAIEKQLGRQLDPDEAIRIECLSDVAELLSQGDRAGR
jgi:acyl carrier protein